MIVALVDPGDLGRMPHLFTLKALTYWRGQGVDVRVAGPHPSIEDFTDPPDLVQVTTPLFSWLMDESLASVRAWAALRSDIEVGGVLASNFPREFEALGIRVRPGIAWEIEACRPACCDFPDLPVSRFFATHGCRGCPLGLMIDPDNGQPACLVPRFEGRELREVPGWEAHVCDRHGGLRELMDNALNMAPPEVLWHVRAAITRPTNLSSGIEANTMDDRAGEILGPVPFRPWRTAFDETREEHGVVRTIEILAANGVPPERVHVYVLYGHRDDLPDAEYRVRRVLEMGAWPFAMRYVPLNWFDGKRTYLPPNWERGDYIDFARWVNRQKVVGLAKSGRPQLDRLMPFDRWKREGRGHAV